MREPGDDLVWCTYARADCGWSCTLRSMQMLVSRAALRAGPADASARAACRARLAAMLIDWPGAALSLRTLIGYGPKPAGERFGPHEVAVLVEQAGPVELGGARPLHTVVCGGGIVQVARVLAAAAPEASGAWGAAVLALVPLRLGLTRRLEHVYHQLLRDALAAPACVGAVAGPCQSAMFVYAVTGAGELAILDPHTVRDTPPAPSAGALGAATVTPRAFVESLTPPAGLQSLPCAELDPSLCLGFLFLCARELRDFCERTEVSVARCHLAASADDCCALPLRLFCIGRTPPSLAVEEPHCPPPPDSEYDGSDAESACSGDTLNSVVPPLPPLPRLAWRRRGSRSPRARVTSQLGTARPSAPAATGNLEICRSSLRMPRPLWSASSLNTNGRLRRLFTIDDVVSGSHGSGMCTGTMAICMRK